MWWAHHHTAWPRIVRLLGRFKRRHATCWGRRPLPLVSSAAYDLFVERRSV